MKTYYLSNYALSEGVKAVSGSESKWMPGWIKPEGFFLSFKLGRDIHETPEAAIAEAQAMRLKKIASLQKQIKKLEAMTFTVKQEKA